MLVGVSCMIRSSDTVIEKICFYFSIDFVSTMKCRMPSAMCANKRIIFIQFHYLQIKQSETLYLLFSTSNEMVRLLKFSPSNMFQSFVRQIPLNCMTEWWCHIIQAFWSNKQLNHKTHSFKLYLLLFIWMELRLLFPLFDKFVFIIVFWWYYQVIETHILSYCLQCYASNWKGSKHIYCFVIHRSVTVFWS